MSTQLAVPSPSRSMPPILAAGGTRKTKENVERFYSNVAAIFETWIQCRRSSHTQRAYREDVLSFVRFAGIVWPEHSSALLRISIEQVQAFRDIMLEKNSAPKTINRRIASLSSFYKYLAVAAAELRLPITVPNPAHAQFISRESTDARDETKALSANRARQLMVLPAGDSVLDYRDRAILKLYLYSGMRLSTGCRVKVVDFHQDGDQATIRLHEKGDKRRTIGLHFSAAQAIQEYVERAGITSGPLFRPRLNSRSRKLGERALDETTMYRLIQSYLERLPGAMKEMTGEAGSLRAQCIYTPHSLRATTAIYADATGLEVTQIAERMWKGSRVKQPQFKNVNR
jgi:site-specific recombinase XerD